jgi:hypothetical protein
LGGRLDEEHAGHHWIVWKMAEEERFIAPEEIPACAAAARLEFGECIQELELWSMGEGPERVGGRGGDHGAAEVGTVTVFGAG